MASSKGTNNERFSLFMLPFMVIVDSAVCQKIAVEFTTVYKVRRFNIPAKLSINQRRWTWTGDFKCREVKTGFCRNRSMQTGSSGTLIGWKSGQTTFVPLWDWMERAWLRTLKPWPRFVGCWGLKRNFLDIVPKFIWNNNSRYKW